MPALFASNPLYDRLTRDAMGLSVRVCLCVAGVLAVVSLIVSTLALLSLNPLEARATQIWQTWDTDLRVRTEYDEMCDMSITLMSIFFAALLLPLASAIVVNNFTSVKTLGDLRFNYGQLVPLTKRQIARGYAYAGLHRARLLVSLAVGLAPGLIGGLLYSLSRIVILQPFVNFELPAPEVVPTPYHPAALDVVGLMMIIAAMVIGLLVLNLLAAVLATALSVRGSEAPAMFVSNIILMTVVFEALVVLTVLGPMIAGRGFVQHAGLSWMWIAIGLCVLPPTLLTLGAMALAGWWSEEKPDTYNRV